MTSDIHFDGPDELSVDEYIRFFQLRQPHISLEGPLVEQVLRRSTVVTARRGLELLGFIRMISDAHIFGAVAEIRWLPEIQNEDGFFERLFTAAAIACPTRLLLGNYRVDADMMKKLGWEPGVMSFAYNQKPRVVTS